MERRRNSTALSCAYILFRMAEKRHESLGFQHRVRQRCADVAELLLHRRSACADLCVFQCGQYAHMLHVVDCAEAVFIRLGVFGRMFEIQAGKRTVYSGGVDVFSLLLWRLCLYETSFLCKRDDISASDYMGYGKAAAQRERRAFCVCCSDYGGEQFYLPHCNNFFCCFLCSDSLSVAEG